MAKLTEINEDEIMMAEEEAREEGTGLYVHVFSKPFTYEGKTYEKLTFDFEALTGRDSMAIEAEMQAMNRPLVIREISGEYQIRIAARACTEKIGYDVLQAMPIKECNKILNRTRAFLLAAE